MIIQIFCKSCEPEIVFVLICPLAAQFHIHRSYKTRESTLQCVGNFEENINLSQFHLAVNRKQCSFISIIQVILIEIAAMCSQFIQKVNPKYLHKQSRKGGEN